MTQRPGAIMSNFFATFGTTEFLVWQSIVPIVAWNDGGEEIRCIGTGFFISASGLLMTAAHVLRDPVDENYASTRRPWPDPVTDTPYAPTARSSTTRRSSPSPHCPRRCRTGSSSRPRRDRPSAAGTARWCTGCPGRSDAAAHGAFHAARSPSPRHR